MADGDFVYAQVKCCGCVVGLVVEANDHRSDTAQAVSEWITAGYAVERMGRIEGVERFRQDCTHKEESL